MTVYIVIRADNGEFLSAWATPKQASEFRNSLLLLNKNLRRKFAYHILAYELDKINSWEMYYE